MTSYTLSPSSKRQMMEYFWKDGLHPSLKVPETCRICVLKLFWRLMVAQHFTTTLNGVLLFFSICHPYIISVMHPSRVSHLPGQQ